MTKPGNGTGHKNIIIGVVAGLLSLLLVLSFFICLLWKNWCDSIPFLRKISEKEQRIAAIITKYGSVAPRKYKFAAVKKMTENFKVTLGKGGFGTVFKGKLSDGREVAVKVLNTSKGEGEDFVNEVVSISKTSHVNVVTLLGFCLEGSNQALIYEFVPNGTLEEFINKDRSSMDALLLWKTLHGIAVGVARGLEYLHRGCKTHIVHFDIKPHNILLDRELRPKIADFGLAKLCSMQKSALSVQGKRGTPGYMAPEFCFPNFGSISSKADVYSYGMMVLQMVKGKINISAGVDNNSENCSVYQMYDHLIQYDSLEAYGVTVDTNEVAKKLMLVGLWCIQKLPAERPTMSRVVEMLEGSKECLEMPPSPKLF
ncbi:LEAF RUST 10 DISEASE-RESISTANCE LOCUS RECEPTOR-LIKE PROTEIN KINASE-like 2.3 [Ananas comosus]|uniref:LEAF RUST 10 DISEASE-RESISTANCE LOCUS RECEPTOR-LIKE PROTEIN KINASE-like 2.3 n=1 Tax=Ananas comosus TaxID=4615 RepID=A0A6P5FRQ1_ANACO|nr:LEAF RUST 10 DISEASE-RESISTANCE LOCUS RECEPTOR-LIKE PROTEIN KINASE-like 2.3 [Ananas comosus]